MVDHSDKPGGIYRAHSLIASFGAVDEAARWAGELEKMRALREAAAAKIEAWRTESATYRGMKV